MGITIKLGGAEKLRENLSQLREAMQRRILAASIRKAMNDVLKPALVAASPSGSNKRKKVRRTKAGNKALGPLKKSWQTRLIKTAQGVHMQLVPQTRTRDAFYARFIEFGWLAGRRITKREIRASQINRTRLRTRTPVPARPFARPAAEAAFTKVVVRVGIELASRIEVEMKRINP